MARVRFRLRGKGNPSEINCRFINGRAFDKSTRIGIYINPIHWDSKNGRVKNVIAVKNRDEINLKLDGLRGYIIQQFGDSFSYGEIINQTWLDNKVAEYFNRPKHEVKRTIKKHFVYVSDFCDWWMDTKSEKWKTGKNKFMNSTQKTQYRAIIKLFKEYEGEQKFTFQKFDMQALEDFVDYLDEDLGYANGTVKKLSVRLRFFINRAKDEGVKGADQISGSVFYEGNDDDVMPPYLNEDMIDKVYELDLSDDSELDAIRDNFIIGLWTGLRISDFNNRLDVTNIDGDYIKIKHKKTNVWSEIPVHYMVREILNKRFGALPPKFSDTEFNEQIKTIGFKCGFKEEIKGGLVNVDKETGRKRKIQGVYPFYKLMSSHICRRSFATNHFGVVANSVIQAVGGWKKEDIMLHYIKKTNRQYASELKKTWDEKYSKKNNK